MIETLHLRNFKCFDDVAFDIRKITLLAGINGTGKSSVIQGLLALRKFCLAPQSANWHGPLVDIGDFRDILYVGAAEDQIGLSVEYTDGKRLRGSFPSVGADDPRASLDEYIDVGLPAPPAGEVELDAEMDGFKRRSLLRKSMFYLSADRLGPRKALPYRLDDTPAGTPLGKRGEHVLWFLGQHERERVVPALCRSGTPTLLDQTNEWLAEVSPGVELTYRSVSEADVAMAGYSFSQKEDVRTKPFRATNVGFGVSYALPMVVALLAATDDDLVIIENPEAHLHPGGQNSIAELAARAAADGRQVILETHSDHVLDGIRLAVAKKIIPEDDVAIYFFSRDDAGVQINSPAMNADGSLDSWPDGFFDQQEKNLARLIELRRR